MVSGSSESRVPTRLVARRVARERTSAGRPAGGNSSAWRRRRGLPKFLTQLPLRLEEGTVEWAGAGSGRPCPAPHDLGNGALALARASARPGALLRPERAEAATEIARLDDTLLVMCRSGGRSAVAVNRLAKAGFENVYNVTDGMVGDVVMSPESVFLGQRLVDGWKNSGLPWTYDVDPGRMLLPAAQQ